MVILMKKPLKNGINLTWILLIGLIALSLFNTLQISELRSGQGTSQVSGAATSATSAGQVLAEITPTGIPSYGLDAKVSFDSVEPSLITLMNYHSSISLEGNDLQRYIKIGNTEDTACEYCCGIGNAGFASPDGSIACGCSHNLAASGLTKWLIQNSDYTDDQIIDELKKWKTLYFPQDSLKEELARRGISPEAAGLPEMVGGC